MVRNIVVGLLFICIASISVYVIASSLRPKAPVDEYSGAGKAYSGVAVPEDHKARYGAFAVSDQTFAWGSSLDYPSRPSAERDAEKRCAKGGAKDCKIALWFYDRCGALAIKPRDGAKMNGGWGSASAGDLGEAEEKALSNCRRFGGNGCGIVESICLQ